jgi:hypothetical protein
MNVSDPQWIANNVVKHHAWQFEVMKTGSQLDSEN